MPVQLNTLYFCHLLDIFASNRKLWAVYHCQSCQSVKVYFRWACQSFSSCVHVGSVIADESYLPSVKSGDLTTITKACFLHSANVWLHISIHACVFIRSRWETPASERVSECLSQPRRFQIWAHQIKASHSSFHIRDAALPCGLICFIYAVVQR